MTLEGPEVGKKQFKGPHFLGDFLDGGRRERTLDCLAGRQPEVVWSSRYEMSTSKAPMSEASGWYHFGSFRNI